MDTRTKIVSLDEALRHVADLGGNVTFVTGYFDPLTVAHARRLRELASGGQSLVALVADLPDALLPREARACLVAGLEAVNRVVMAGPEELPAGARVVSELDADLERRAALMAHVRSRG